MTCQFCFRRSRFNRLSFTISIGKCTTHGGVTQRIDNAGCILAIAYAFKWRVAYIEFERGSCTISELRTWNIANGLKRSFLTQIYYKELRQRISRVPRSIATAIVARVPISTIITINNGCSMTRTVVITLARRGNSPPRTRKYLGRSCHCSHRHEQRQHESNFLHVR